MSGHSVEALRNSGLKRLIYVIYTWTRGYDKLNGIITIIVRHVELERLGL